MILYIDTTDFNKAMFALTGGKRIQKKSYSIDPHKSHETLGCLADFLSHHKIKMEEGTPLPIKKIVVNKGPGSYTGVRVGAAIALALGFAWKVPVRAVAKDKFDVR